MMVMGSGNVFLRGNLEFADSGPVNASSSVVGADGNGEDHIGFVIPWQAECRQPSFGASLGRNDLNHLADLCSCDAGGLAGPGDMVSNLETHKISLASNETGGGLRLIGSLLLWALWVAVGS